MERHPLLRCATAILFAFALGGCEFSCSVGGGPNLDEIRSQLQEQTGQEVELDCPKIEKKGTTECQVTTTAGAQFRITIQPGEEKDRFKWHTVDPIVVGKKMQADLVTAYQRDYEIKLEKPKCPEFLVLQPDSDVRCQARSSGIDVEVKVVMKDGKPSIYAPVKGFINSEAAAGIASKEMAKQGLEMQVDCGVPVRVSAPGSRFKCTATDKDGKQYPLFYKVTDTTGGINIQTSPF